MGEQNVKLLNDEATDHKNRGIAACAQRVLITGFVDVAEKHSDPR